ncbi:TPA: hypothetical protein DCZ39_05450 [Patescibacteria group bacterium]|nr:hypothetical protein [Candidatus Gracilibacteria bacterium]
MSFAISYAYPSSPDPVSVLAFHAKLTKNNASPLSGYVSTGVVGGVESDHLVVRVNIPVPRPIVTYQVTSCTNHELLFANAFT